MLFDLTVASNPFKRKQTPLQEFSPGLLACVSSVARAASTLRRKDVRFGLEQIRGIRVCDHFKAFVFCHFSRLFVASLTALRSK
jgi:hypothetical protein